ncbi:hypothetical protein SAMN05444487_105151 [Marininema mesophilum]|uniref:Polymerase/histidinol phosphatase N-terminal domain-containing protein n=1 Tax=Marininema mesophilum TaxID=1048340 RepID=A0A1H2VNA9_9BACL|nr:PHP domain-containing protein [Marininema mesophilum]SDW69444.1 hypothetical protein SAMN05444487_105151 [Marininema mesophilum]
MSILNDLIPGTFDLHIHTTASDGTLTPSEVVTLAKQSGLTTIAITDHDTLLGLAEASDAGQKHGIRIIPGIELSSRYEGHAVDILGYNLYQCDELEVTLVHFRKSRENRAQAILDRLNELGVNLTMDQVLTFAEGGSIGRPHIGRALVQHGYVPDLRAAFDLYLADDRPAAVPKRTLHPEEAIQLIHQAGGQAVLAHPALIRNDAIVQTLLQTYPFDGIEIWHRSHTLDDAGRYRALAKQLDLLITGGSDFHAPPHQLGKFHA